MEDKDIVLLIDDDEVTNFLNMRLLLNKGIAKEVLISKNGVEALRLLNDRLQKALQMPKIILVDINMPMMNGFEFLIEYEHLVFKGKEDTLVYLLTTSTNSKDLLRAKDFPIQGVINKPLNSEKILGLVKNA